MIRNNSRRLPIAALCLLCLCAPLIANAQDGHPSYLPILQKDDSFPRFTAEQLFENGYPDHQHAYFSPNWKALTDEAGRSYGVGSICKGLVMLEPEGLKSESGALSYGPITLRYDPNLQPCQVALFVELCDMALHLYADLLDLQPQGRLEITNPEKIADYTAATGHGTWRMFKLDGDECIVEPVGVLANRTLIGHAAIDMVGQWLLRERSDDLPEWFIQGLGCYISEMGTHFLSYMAPYRQFGTILISAAEVEKSLRAPAMPDPGAYKRMFRIARYSAFLMVWRLVEHEGGLKALGAFLQALEAGQTPDAAAVEAYGRDLSTLAMELDPRLHGEPVGDAVAPRNPSRIPARGAEKQGPSR